MSDRTLIDTNVLVYALDTDSRQHLASKEALAAALSPDGELCVVQQVLAEFYATITNPKRVPRPLGSAVAADEIESLLALPGLTLLPQPADLTETTLELLRRVPVGGAGIFDLQIAAAALGNRVRRVLTYDTKVFSRIEDLAVVLPGQ